MRSNRFLAAAGVSAALALGAVAGFALGVPGVSGAQTTDTTPPSTVAPSDEVPSGDAPDGTRDRENCPDKEGGAARGSSSSEAGVTNLSLRRF